MSEFGWVGLYSALILAGSMLGGYLPFLGQVTHARMQLYLSASAGVMLGASFFHVMPEAMELAGVNFGWWMSLGVVGLFCIERFLAPHSHEMDGPGHKHVGESDCGHSQEPHTHAHAHDHHDHDHDHSHDHGHDHAHAPAPGPRVPAAPAVAGWMAVLGLTIHTFMNGVGLAGAVHAEHPSFQAAAHDDHDDDDHDHDHDHAGHSHAHDTADHDHSAHDHAGHSHSHDADHHHHHDHAEAPAKSGIVGILAGVAPGLALFLAIALHKPADALAVTMMLSRKGIARPMVMLTQVGFALMVPLGAIAFVATRGAVQQFWGHGDENAAAAVQQQITGAALAFSAGTFLFIALSDLLPEVQFHRHDRVKLFLALVAGVALMGFIAVLEGHDHGGHGHSHGAAVDEHDHDHDHDGHSHGAAKPKADAADDCCAECKADAAAKAASTKAGQPAVKDAPPAKAETATPSAKDDKPAK